MSAGRGERQGGSVFERSRQGDRPAGKRCWLEPSCCLARVPGSGKDHSGAGSVCVSGRPRALRFHVSYLLQGSVFPFLLPAFQRGCRGQRVRDGSYAGGPKLGSGGHNYSVTIQKTILRERKGNGQPSCITSFSRCTELFFRWCSVSRILFSRSSWNLCFLGCILCLLSLFPSL